MHLSQLCFELQQPKMLALSLNVCNSKTNRIKRISKEDYIPQPADI